MQSGTVKWFDSVKNGYGFIVPDQPGDDVFVHQRDLDRAGIETLAEGQRVRFLAERNKRGRVSAGSSLPSRSTPNSSAG